MAHLVEQTLNSLQRRLGILSRSFQGTRVRQNSAQTTTNGASAQITVDTIVFDTPGWWDSTNNQIVVAKADIYLITAGLSFATNATGYRQAKIAIASGATSVAFQEVSPSGGGSARMSVATVMALDGDENVRLYGFQTSGGNLNTDVASAAATWLAVQRIGRR